MVRKIAAWLILLFAIVVLASIAYRLETFTWKVPLAVVASLVGLVGAIGLLRTWPYAHHMAGFFLFVTAGLTVWNAVEMHMLDGRGITSTAYMTVGALLGLGVVIYDYLKTRT